MVTAEDIDDVSWILHKHTNNHSDFVAEQMDFDLPAGPTASTSSRMAAADSSSADRRTWTVVYPIYLDSKASKQHRRVSKDLAVPWPLARLMAVECARLGLKTHLEVRPFQKQVTYSHIDL